MRAFIIRPFGTKKDIDFDAVERQLIGPALEQIKVDGRTTLDILRAGNIRIDMFQRLLTADLVIADVSIDNANVFYELGIRHALRDRRTFLLRCEADHYPFDLSTDRYLAYDRANPGASLDTLVQALRQTLDSDAEDSPVFRSLPELVVQDRSAFLPIPRDFREEVERAENDERLGDLELLAAEVSGFEWESAGLRLVGRAQSNLAAWEGARETWEAIRNLDPEDYEANDKLGTVYQHLGDLTRSDQALERVLGRKGLDLMSRAEALSLLGSNAKIRWIADWRQAPEAERRAWALRSPYLDQAADAYGRGYRDDFRHFYSGSNALALVTVLIELAAALPEVWAERFDSPEEAAYELTRQKKEATRLVGAVELALDAAKARLEHEVKTDPWVGITEADLCCLTARHPQRVAGAYRKALAGAPDFAVDSARRQLDLYRQLGVLADNVTAALSVFPPAAVEDGAEAGACAAAGPRPRVLLFAGHRIDAPGHTPPCFPADKEEVARAKIREAVEAEKAQPGGVACGIASGASGGDILFHEVCAELGIRTHLYLAEPRPAFIRDSVAVAGPGWVERFDRLYEALARSRRVLAETEELPRWLCEKPGYSLWQRSNLWMLHNALSEGRDRVTLIALWNGQAKASDDAGDVADLVRQARDSGAKTIVLGTASMFGSERTAA